MQPVRAQILHRTEVQLNRQLGTIVGQRVFRRDLQFGIEVSQGAVKIILVDRDFLAFGERARRLAGTEVHSHKQFQWQLGPLLRTACVQVDRNINSA